MTLDTPPANKQRFRALAIRFPALAGLLVLSFLIRCLRFRQVIGSDSVYFFGTDPFYHMRRIFVTLANYPHVPPFDYYVNFPEGSYIVWPAGFDFILATIILLLGQDASATLAVEKICAWSIPALGTLTIALFYLLARQYVSPLHAWWATLFLALSNPHILISRIGRVDHHVLEVLFPMIAFLFYVLALKKPAKSWAWLLHHLLAGLFFGLSFSIWTGSVMFLGTFFGYLLIQLIIYIYNNEVDITPLILGGQLVMAAATLTLLPLCLTSPWGKEGQILYVALSWFHFLVPFYGLIILLVLGRLFPGIKNRPQALGRYLLVIILTAFVLIGLTILIRPESLQTFRDAWEFVTVKEKQISDVNESRSIWAPISLGRHLYGPLLWILPFMGLYGLLRPFWHSDNRRPKQMVLCIWFLSTLILSSLQLRFNPSFSLPLSLYWVLLLKDLQQAAGRIGEGRKKTRLYQSLVAPAYLFILLAAVQTGITQAKQPDQGNFLTTFHDIARLTPPTDHYWQPEQKPQYGILSHWSFGHFINYLSHRPNIANPFGQAQWHLRGVDNSYRFFLAETETEALDLCRRLEARYVLATTMSGPFNAFVKFQKKLFPDRFKGQDPKAYLEKHYRCVMNNRLLLSDGTAEGLDESCVSQAPLSHFRLIYESEFTSKDHLLETKTSFHKLFEVVEGAHVEGLALPGSAITLNVTVKTNLERTFPYVQRCMADQEGRFAAILPYATEAEFPASRTSGPWRLSSSQKTMEIHLSEEDIRTGKVVPVDLR